LVELVAVAICIYPRIMVRAEEDVPLAPVVQVEPVAAETVAAELLLGLGLAPASALAVVVDFKLAGAPS
jgi:hypothetical protein